MQEYKMPEPFMCSRYVDTFKFLNSINNELIQYHKEHPEVPAYVIGQIQALYTIEAAKASRIGSSVVAVRLNHSTDALQYKLCTLSPEELDNFAKRVLAKDFADEVISWIQCAYPLYTSKTRADGSVAIELNANIAIFPPEPRKVLEATNEKEL